MLVAAAFGNIVGRLLGEASRVVDGLGAGELLAVVRYLASFGYLSDENADVGEAIKRAQKILGIDQDGVVGMVTLKAMQNTPRCGCPDYAPARAEINKWGKKTLHYHVKGYVRGISEAVQEDIFARAWKGWQDVCDLKVVRGTADKFDFLIDSSNSRREDFGTAGNVLAWCYLPQGPNHDAPILCKFDLAERWSESSQPSDGSIPLETVAEHEFGHGLGLDHTQILGELLYPTLDIRVDRPQPRYDIPQVVARYGASEIVPEPEPKAGITVFIPGGKLVA